MANVEECRLALERFSDQLSGLNDAERGKHPLERTVSCRLSDPDVTFYGRLKNARLIDITTDEPAERAQLRLSMPGDVLVAMVDGEYSFASAWAKGKLKVEASIFDLIRLRNLF